MDLKNKNQRNELFYKVFDKFHEAHPDCFHFSDHIYARELFDLIIDEINLLDAVEEIKDKYNEKAFNDIKALHPAVFRDFELTVNPISYSWSRGRGCNLTIEDGTKYPVAEKSQASEFFHSAYFLEKVIIKMHYFDDTVPYIIEAREA